MSVPMRLFHVIRSVTVRRSEFDFHRILCTGSEMVDARTFAQLANQHYVTQRDLAPLPLGVLRNTAGNILTFDSVDIRW